MNAEGVPLIALEIVLGFAVPLGWGVWQLIDLRREREADRRKADLARQAEQAASAGIKPDVAASGTAASPAPRDARSGPG